MDDIECPRCKTTKYRNPNLKLMVNVCGHALCENCVELLFVKGSAACPRCNTALRRTNFRFQIFEDPGVEKEVDIRRKILKDFNRKEEDFDSLRDYNDYLEEVETIILNLANGVDLEATKRKVDKYKKDNKTQIVKNKGKLSKEEEELEDMLENEKSEQEFHKQQVMEEELEREKQKRRNKEALVDELINSDRSAKEILALHASTKDEEQKHKRIPIRKNPFSNRMQSQQRVFLPVPRQSNHEAYSYKVLVLDNCGPKNFSPASLKNRGFIQHVRGASDLEVASGFLTENACDRALQDAFCGIYFTP